MDALDEFNKTMQELTEKTKLWNSGRKCTLCGIEDGNIPLEKQQHEECLKKEKEKQEELELLKHHGEWVDNVHEKHILFAMSRGVGLRHSVCTFENYVGDYSVVSEWLIKPHKENLIIQSDRSGNGKTHLAVAILKQYAVMSEYPKRRKGIFVQFTEMMQFIRSAFDSKDISESDIIDFFSSSDLLIIDDIGSEKITDYVLATLYVILNRRYESNKATVVTTNESSVELTEKYGSRIVSRMASGMVQKIAGSDNRITKTVHHSFDGISDKKRNLKELYVDWQRTNSVSLINFGMYY